MAEQAQVFKRVRFYWDRAAWTGAWLTGAAIGEEASERWLAVGPGLEEWCNVLNSGADPGSFYEPLVRHSGLFRTFADVGPDEDGMREFARKYGPLGIQEPYRGEFPEEWAGVLRMERDPLSGSRLSRASLSLGDPTCYGERLSHWREAASRMREAVALWDAVRSAELAQVKAAVLPWTSAHVGQTFVATPQPQYLGDEARSLSLVESVGRAVGSAEVAPTLASTLLDRFINAHLHVFGSVGFGAKGRTQANLYLTSRNLLGAMWLQFALAVDGDKDYETCAGCGDWFEIGGAGGKRPQSKHCSEACKARAYRKRKGAGNGQA